MTAFDWNARMVPLARRNLLAEKGRLAMSVAGVASAVLLILIVVSLYRGWSQTSQVFTELPGDLWITQEGTSDPLRSFSFLPAGASDELESLPDVQAALPAYARRVAVRNDGGDSNVFFMGLEPPTRVPADDDVRIFFPGPGRITVGRAFAQEADVEVGDSVEVLGRELTVQHIRPGGNPLFGLAFVNSVDARELLGLEGFVSFYVVAAGPGADLDSVGEAAVAVVPGSEIHTSAEFAEAMGEVVNQGFLPVVGVLVAIGLIIGGAVIALTTYTATVEKARDFGVLKALGASGPFVYRIVIGQSLMIGIVGAASGVAASALAATLIKRGVPEFITDLQWTDAVGVFLLAIVVSVVAAYVPIRRINSIDPAMVFRA